MLRFSLTGFVLLDNYLLLFADLSLCAVVSAGLWSLVPIGDLDIGVSRIDCDYWLNKYSIYDNYLNYELCY